MVGKCVITLCLGDDMDRRKLVIMVSCFIMVRLIIMCRGKLLCYCLDHDV